MFRLNPFVRVGLCLSAISCVWPVLAVDDDGETMVVTASSVEQNEPPRVSWRVFYL
ncbi:colicin I receptor [Escherichia coli]|nr:colicin I receptor [Escherichia coli]